AGCAEPQDPSARAALGSAHAGTGVGGGHRCRGVVHLRGMAPQSAVRGAGAGRAGLGLLLLVHEAVHLSVPRRAGLLARDRARRGVPGHCRHVERAVVRPRHPCQRRHVLGGRVRRDLRDPGSGLRPAAGAPVVAGEAGAFGRAPRRPHLPLPGRGALPVAPVGSGVPRRLAVSGRRGGHGRAAHLRALDRAGAGSRQARPGSHRPGVLPGQRGRVDHVLRVRAARPVAAAMSGASRGAGAPVTLAITGASGAPYAVRLLSILAGAGVAVRVIVSETGWRLLREAEGIADEAALRARTGAGDDIVFYDDQDRGATPASGSAPSAGMVVCPCSMGTLASIAQGTTRSLIERAADVALKERRPLVLVPRETPYSA